MKSNLKTLRQIMATPIITQKCKSCETIVSEKKMYPWIDPSDNIYGFNLFKPYYRIFSLKPQPFFVKEQLYYNVLCIDCAKKDRKRTQCFECDRYYDNTMQIQNHSCLLCIEKKV